MAMDFKIDNKGDFIISKSATHPLLRLDFVESDYPVLRVDFEQGRSSSTRRSIGRLRIDFATDKDNRVLDKRFSTTHDLNELRQRIMIRLRTEKGEMPLLPNLGSYIVTRKHEDILSEETLAAIKNIVTAEISDIVESPNVVVKQKKIDGPFFCQNLNVYIYDDTTLLYDFSL